MLSRCYADLWLIMQAEVLRSRGKVLEAMALFDQTLTLDPYNIHATMLKASLFVHILSFQSPFLQGTCWKQLNQSEKVQYFTALCGAFIVVARRLCNVISACWRFTRTTGARTTTSAC